MSRAVPAANHNYGGGNPMRPHRVRLTHSLVANYGLNSKMYVHRPQARSPAELEQFHCDGARCVRWRSLPPAHALVPADSSNFHFTPCMCYAGECMNDSRKSHATHVAVCAARASFYACRHVRCMSAINSNEANRTGPQHADMQYCHTHASS